MEDNIETARKKRGDLLKIIAFQGSPRTTKSCTDVVLKRFLKGAESAGATSEIVYLATKKISPCIGCFTCWAKTPGRCIQEDDMKELLEMLRAADLVIYATPVYIHNVTGHMKNFMDRTIPIVQPFQEQYKDTYRHPVRYPEMKGKKMLVISVCGYPVRDQFTALSDMFRKSAINSQIDLVGEIYRAGAEPLYEDSDHILHRGFLRAVEKAGKEVVEIGKISEGLRKKLDKNIPMPKVMFAKVANVWWKKKINKCAKHTVV